MKFYAGIGSRETPIAQLHRLTAAATNLRKTGWILRSGGAPGADTAFEKGAKDEKRIYLPWNGCFGRKFGDGIVVDNYYHQGIAQKHHPAWEKCTSAAKKMHTRNVAQIIGDSGEMELSKFVLCWTKDGNGEGGTGQALRVAKTYKVPIYDFATDGAEQEFYSRWLTG